MSASRLILRASRLLVVAAALACAVVPQAGAQPPAQDYPAVYNRALQQAERQQYEAAERSFRRAIAIKNREGISDARPYNALGWLYVLMGRFSDAEEFLLQALQSREQAPPGFREKVLNNLGTLYIRIGDAANARRYLTLAVREFDSAVARENLQLLDRMEREQRRQRRRRTPD
ncbi:MAG: tetratricopeptide repeat protein [Rhodothermales bacterium]|nr:tetratricopeptide repeat protein [Rhodothermales bacterium]